MSLTWSLQALLIRHEAYVADAEACKSKMADEIESLSKDKKDLEAKNTAINNENRRLQDELQSFNSTVDESDVQVRALTDTLHSTQAELQKLNVLASRTESLERELEQFEQDQVSLQASFAIKTEETKAATLRWQRSEKTISALEDQIGALEREAQDDKDRHLDVVGRLERRRLVEQELSNPTARLRGTGSVKAADCGKTGTSVVSHFVKDILQDNANLQTGIVELRDMLNNSNEEVERLRYQLARMSPMEEKEQSSLSSSPPIIANGHGRSLSQEMSRASAQEVHVHHHYHAPPTAAEGGRRASQNFKRPKKKRNSSSAGHFTPSLAFHTPRSSVSLGGRNNPTSAAAILSQTAVSIPPPRPPGHRWSMHSTQTGSSTPSSPQSSSFCATSLFDRSFSDAGLDSSRPTTPDSEDLGSPLFASKSSKRFSDSSFRNFSGSIRSFSSPQVAQPKPVRAAELLTPDFALDSAKHGDGLLEPASGRAAHEAIPEESEYDSDAASGILAAEEHFLGHGQDHASSGSHGGDDHDFSPPINKDSDYFARPLRRAASHDSLFSLSGMDIHTLRSRPSQMLAGHYAQQPGRVFSSQTTAVSATTAVATVFATRPVMMQRPSDRTRSLLSGMAADQRQPARRQSSTNNSNTGAAAKDTLSRRVGGWVFGRWGSTPAPAPASPSKAGLALETVTVNARSASSGSVVVGGSKHDAAGLRSPRMVKTRMPGINQSGPIGGLAPKSTVAVAGAVREPVMRNFDEEALRQSLMEG